MDLAPFSQRAKRSPLRGKMVKREQLLLGIIALVLPLAGCSSQPATPTATSAATLIASTGDSVRTSEYLDLFETVWQTINDTYFDPTFGGLDWHEVHNRYRPSIAAVQQDETFYELINEMLFELNVSHIGVVPPDEKEQLEPILSANGNVGIEVRLLGDEAVITSVRPGSPGAKAGLRPGFVVERIEGKTVQQIAEETLLIPPWHERNRRKQVTGAILSRLYGPAGEAVSITYLDENGVRHEQRIVRAEREGRVVLDPALPPFFIEFEARRLDGDIGYVRFNAFLPPVHERFAEAVASFRDTRGLIVDLRGNHGGFFEVRKALAERLNGERVLFWSYKGRDSTREVYLEPARDAYTGPLVVLIDVMSLSSAEEFSGAMQAIDRAVIVGERSAGICVVADWMQLPNGATFMYPVAQTQTADGMVLEGHGVIPDVEVALDRDLLLEGIDSQLEAAIKQVEQQASE
jgi:carboxyl-terminal processing protease